MRASLLSSIAILLVACAGPSSERSSKGALPEESEERPTSCPASAPAPHPLPGIAEEALTLAYWLERTDELDEPLLTTREIAAHVRAIAENPGNGLPTDRASLAAPIPPEHLEREVRERLSYLREGLEQYVDASGAPLEAARFADVPLRPLDELRVALEPIPLRCGPQVEGFYRPPVDLDFDRNACSQIRPQEPVQILMHWPNGMQLARTRYALGWIAPGSALSPPLSEEQREAFTKGASVRAPAGTKLRSSDGAAALELEDLTLLPSRDDGREVLFADARGVHRASAEGLLPTLRPLTRRAVLEEAFARLDHPYGWGDREGGVDCSRFVMDVLATFGLELPRHSSRQADSGTYSIDLREIEDTSERERLIDAAARQGIVLLYFRGHIMLYLGRDAQGTPSVIHSFSEYLEPCEDGETLRRVDRVTVSDLTLGRGSSRRSFLERIERVVILGRRAGVELMGVATPREPAPIVLPPARACTDSLEKRIFRSPARPNRHQPLRVIATATEELGPVGLVFVDPKGKRHHPPIRRLGGPPFAYWAEIEKPRAGIWTVALGDGANVAACERIRVSPHPPRAEPPDPERIWEPRLRWEADTEAFYAAFVEQLFDYPIDDDRTWAELSVVLQDSARNILFNHLGQDEEARMPLRPDCADLPYFLRAYFAWKLRLPFAYRSCSRGRAGRPPSCGEIAHPGMPHEYDDEVDAFAWFLNRHVKRVVHSASGRTHPNDSETALYPIPMTREALRPGTVFSDPYGHLLVVARWVPQGAGDRYGILIGADAQPDGTVGRRRFWRGTFLFDADTTDVGAGFKAFRPVLYDRREQVYETLPNEAITERAGYVPFSTAQYDDTTDAFYERMEALINPRPLDAWQAQVTLVDALEESAVRRIVSVQNGEEWKANNPDRVMEMPDGTGIFLTAGAWEDYSTPSRDLRLLIAMDTVLGFPDVVRRHPSRFGLEEADASAAVELLRTRLREELARRSFRYRRSDGGEQTLTLADLFERAANLEMAYNPNDCVEIRWGAPEGSDERRSCRRTAPPEHRAKMAEYREWFATRRRPVH